MVRIWTMDNGKWSDMIVSMPIDFWQRFKSIGAIIGTSAVECWVNTLIP